MKIGVIGANGNLGSKLVKHALENGFAVKVFVYHGNCQNLEVQEFERNLFDLTKDDLKDVDILISAFGAGFKVDPIINQKAFKKYIELLKNTDKKLIAIAGAGSLYIDKNHNCFEYQSENHPKKLKEISKYICLGVNEIEKDNSFNWTVVCPSRFFDLNGPYTGEYLIGEDREIIYNDDKQSYVTYEDLARAMIDIAKNNLYYQKVITVASKKGGQ